MADNPYGIRISDLSPDVREKVGEMVFAPHKLRYFAPYLMGMWLDALFLGCLIALFVRWLITSSATEKRWTKVLILYLIVIHLGTSGYTLATQIHLFVQGFDEYKNFLSVDRARAPFTLHTFSRVPCAAFFTHRAWLMHQKNIIIPIFIVPMLLAYAGCSFAISATWDTLPIPPVTQKLIIAMAATSLSFDTILTILLAIGLLRCKTGWDGTDALVSRILRLTVEAQLPPTIVAALLLMTGSDIVYFNSAPKVHVICLLIILGSRVDLAKQASSHGGQAYMHDSIELGSTTGASTANVSIKNTDGVRVDSVTHVSYVPDGPLSSNKSVNRLPTSPTYHLDDKESFGNNGTEQSK